MGRKKINLSTIILFIGLILIVSGGLLCPFSNSSNKSKQEEKPKEKIIGNDTYGYLSVPSDWIDTKNDREGIVVSNNDKTYTISINKIEETNSNDLKTKFIEELKNENAINIKIDYLDQNNIQIESLPDNGNKWMTIIIYNNSEQSLTTIRIDGPIKKENYYNILNTYKEKDS